MQLFPLEVVNDRYDYFSDLQITIICRSDKADYLLLADYLTIYIVICIYVRYLQIGGIHMQISQHADI